MRCLPFTTSDSDSQFMKHKRAITVPILLFDLMTKLASETVSDKLENYTREKSTQVLSTQEILSD